jgi:hypothetical protein
MYFEEQVAGVYAYAKEKYEFDTTSPDSIWYGLKNFNGQPLSNAYVNLGSFRVVGTQLFEGTDQNDYLTYGEEAIRQLSLSLKTLYFELRGGNDVARLGDGDDIVTGIGSARAPMKAFVSGGNGFDYISEDLTASGWQASRPYGDASLLVNRLQGKEWIIFDDTEAIGSDNYWYLTKDMRQNKFIPLTWNEVLNGGKSYPLGKTKRGRRKKSGRKLRKKK